MSAISLLLWSSAGFFDRGALDEKYVEIGTFNS
jgi:hypothetical protein